MAKGKKQSALPGMENRRIEDLHAKGIELEAVRKSRMELTQREVALVDEIRILMDKNGKTESGYKIDGVEIEVVPPDVKTKIKVRVEHESEEDGTKPGEVKHVSPQDGADFNEGQDASVQ